MSKITALPGVRKPPAVLPQEIAEQCNEKTLCAVVCILDEEGNATLGWTSYSYDKIALCLSILQHRFGDEVTSD